MYIRVRDKHTKHEFDVPENSILLRRGSVERVKSDRFPPAQYPRRPKHHTKLAPSRGRDVAASAGDETTTTEE